MKRASMILICAVAVLLAQGCKEEGQERVERKIGVLKSVDELEVQWDKLYGIVNSNSDLQKEAERVLTIYMKNGEGATESEGLRRIYNMIRDPNCDPSLAKAALRFFVRVDAEEVIRESLLHKNRDVITIACESITAKAKRNVRDEAAMPYLIYVLDQNNYFQRGSEAATVHANMKRRLIEAIQQTAKLDIDISKIDENDPEQVERVLSQAKNWAKRKGIRLFKE